MDMIRTGVSPCGATLWQFPRVAVMSCRANPSSPRRHIDPAGGSILSTSELGPDAHFGLLPNEFIPKVY